MKCHSNFRLIYLSHPLTTGGKPIEANRESAASLTSQMQAIFGNRTLVFNPCALVVPKWDCETFMGLYARMFGSGVVNAVYFAPGWASSRGCQQEWFGAKCLGIPRVLIHVKGGPSTNLEFEEVLGD